MKENHYLEVNRKTTEDKLFPNTVGEIEELLLRVSELGIYTGDELEPFFDVVTLVDDYGETVNFEDWLRTTLLAQHRKYQESILQILWQIDYDVDVDKEPTIADEAWANQYESKAEAFWYGEAEGLKTFKKAIELIKNLTPEETKTKEV